MKNKLPAWFEGMQYDKGDTVKNPFSGEEYELNATELSMYDFVMGATAMSELGIFNTPHHIKQLRLGLDWFREHNAEAYMTLLD